MGSNSLQLVSLSLASTVDATLAAELLKEAEDLERQFALRKWKYSQLDGGRLCEVAARIVYAADSGVLNRTKDVESCINYIENNQVAHGYPDRQALLHIVKVIKSVYKLRSQRGAVHVTPKYTADEIDSRYVVEGCRWILADVLRLFAAASRNAVAKIIEELSAYPTPLVNSYGDRRLLQHTSFTTEEEVLALLYFGPNEGLSVPELVRNIPKAASGVRNSIKQLAATNKREVIVNSNCQITDLGTKRIESVIATKARNG